MNLKEIYGKEYEKSGQPVLSYEVFPPKDDADGEKTESLFLELKKLCKFNPSLISVTYGAGGSNRNESVEIISRIKNELKVTPMPHFTCVSVSRDNIRKYIETIESMGIENILALRGDLPEDGNFFHDFKYASELVEFIKKISRLSVAAASYPEGHKEAVSLEKDIEYLKQKVEKGVDVLYTQMFFYNEHYYNFAERCEKIGIQVPVIPGILPVTSCKQLDKMTLLAKTEVPKKMRETFERHQDDKDYMKKYGIEYAAQQCSGLLKFGVKGLHFYTLNKAESVSRILTELGFCQSDSERKGN